MNYRLRFAIIYRSERKKILHSQLHLISYLEEVLEMCFQIKTKEELPFIFKKFTFAETEDEKDSNSGREDFFLRRLYARDYLQQLFELTKAKLE